jgi:hypothetical protein
MPDLRQIVMVIAVDTQRQYPAPICPHCGKPMGLARTIPGIGALPELHIFDCKQCGVSLTESGEPGQRRAAY